MRNIIKYLLLSILILGCEVEQNNRIRANMKNIFDKEHKLRRLVNKTEKESHWDAGFFILIGAGSGSSKQRECVYFSWEEDDSLYVISRMEVTKIRVKIVDNIDIPTIKFKWDGFIDVPGTMLSIYNENEINKIIQHHVQFATIKCKAEDWKLKIEMPL